MKAIHKYKQAARQGDKEAIRRINQSMGYKHSLYDEPKLIDLLHKAGIIDRKELDVLPENTIISV